MSDKKPTSSKPTLSTIFDEDEEQIEVSKITNFEDLYRKMEKVERISLSTRSKVKAIPEITTELAKLTGLHKSIEYRVTHLEERHHDCVQVDAISQVQSEIMANREDHSEIVRITEKLVNLNSSTDKIVKTMKTIDTGKTRGIIYAASLALANIAILVSAAWFLSAMNTDVKTIQRDLSKQNTIEANDLCRHMSIEEKTRVRTLFPNKQIPYSCIAE